MDLPKVTELIGGTAKIQFGRVWPKKLFSISPIPYLFSRCCLRNKGKCIFILGGHCHSTLKTPGERVSISYQFQTYTKTMMP